MQKIGSGALPGFRATPPADADPAAQVAQVQPRRLPVSPINYQERVESLLEATGRSSLRRDPAQNRRWFGWPVGAIRKAPAQTHDPIFRTPQARGDGRERRRAPSEPTSRSCSVCRSCWRESEVQHATVCDRHRRVREEGRSWERMLSRSVVAGADTHGIELRRRRRLGRLIS